MPLCPVYGLGACLILWLAPLGRGPLWVAVSGGLAATGAELVLGAFYRDALGGKFWDYQGHCAPAVSLPCSPFLCASAVSSPRPPFFAASRAGAGGQCPPLHRGGSFAP